MSIEQPENGSDASLKTEKLESATSKLDTLGWALLRWWGVIFRTLFICAIGTVGWFWIDPQSISDIPLSQLTLKQIFRNLFAVLIVIGCARWFFDFPEQTNDKNPEENPYVGWGQFGGFIVIVAVLATYWANKP
jgi:hypothetical protein